MFSSIGGMDYFRCTYSGEITVSLIAENNRLWPRAFHAGGDRRCPSVSSFADIEVEIVVAQHRAAHRGYSYRPLTNTEFIDNLGDQPLNNPMAAA